VRSLLHPHLPPRPPAARPSRSPSCCQRLSCCPSLPPLQAALEAAAEGLKLENSALIQQFDRLKLRFEAESAAIQEQAGGDACLLRRLRRLWACSRGVGSLHTLCAACLQSVGWQSRAG